MSECGSLLPQSKVESTELAFADSEAEEAVGGLGERDRVEDGGLLADRDGVGGDHGPSGEVAAGVDGIVEVRAVAGETHLKVRV